MSAHVLSPFSPLHAVGRLAILDRLRPKGHTTDGRTYSPFYDGGNPTLVVGGLLAGEVFVVDHDASTLSEHQLLRDTSSAVRARYPDHAPRMPGSAAVTATAQGSSDPFASLSAFKSGARGNLGLAAGEGATYARSAARRYRVLDAGALAASLAEASPVSRKLTRLVGANAQQQPVEGWVYVESSDSSGDDTVFQLHQLVPAGMVLPPAGVVEHVAHANPNNWDLKAWIAAKAGVGMQYCRGVCWLRQVHSNSDVQAAGDPTAPATPAGVEAWS